MKYVFFAIMILLSTNEIHAQVVPAKEVPAEELTLEKIKKKLLEESKHVRTEGGAADEAKKYQKQMDADARAEGVEIPADKATLGKGLYGKKKKAFDDKAAQAPMEDKTGILGQIVEEGQRDFNLYRPKMKVMKDNSINELADAAEDLMNAKGNGQIASKTVAIGSEKITVTETKSCKYSELSERVEFTCKSEPVIACASERTPVRLSSSEILMLGRENAKGSWTFASQSPIPTKNIFNGNINASLYEESIYFDIEDVNAIPEFRINSLRYEDQIDVRINGTWVFRGIGGIDRDYSTRNENELIKWSTQKDRAFVGGGGDGGGPRCMPTDRPGDDALAMEMRPECEGGGGGGISVNEVFTDYSITTKGTINLKPHLINGRNVIVIRLGVGKRQGQVSLNIDFKELCVLGETLVRTCEPSNLIASLTNITTLSPQACIGSPTTYTVEGQSYNSACSLYSETLSGITSPKFEPELACNAYRPPDCDPPVKTCLSENELGCAEGRLDFQCRKQVPKTTVTMTTEDFSSCPDGACVESEKAEAEVNLDDLDRLVKMDAAVEKKDPKDLKIFSGKALTCGKALAVAGLRDCCTDKGLLDGITQCNAAEKQISISRSNEMAFRIGTYRTGSNVKRRKHEAWCTYDSMISKIVAEHVFMNFRNRIDVGRKNSWNCRFVTADLVQEIDWDKIDFKPLMKSMKLEGNAKDSADGLMNDAINGTGPYAVPDDERVKAIIKQKIQDRFLEEMEMGVQE